MARSGIYKSEVIRARQALLAEGRNPSIDAVREALGTGSKTTIHRFLKEIDEEEGGKTGAKIAISEALQDLVRRLAARLHEESDERVQALQASHAGEIRLLKDEQAQVRADQNAMRSRLERLEADLLDERQQHADSQARTRDLEVEGIRLTQENSGLREQLHAEEGHRRSLEEKHQQAHRSLEYFRTAAREQREQESRKHEQQIQFLQSELRTINQSLSVKQHEASTAHQENARLLSELAHAQAASRAALEDARLLKERLNELSFAKTKVDELVERVATLQADNLRLEDALTRQVAEFVALGKQHRQLETDLTIKQASVDAQREAFDLLAKRLQVARTDKKKPAKTE